MVLVMMAVGVVLIPVRASQLYSRLAARRAVAGVLPGSSRNKRPYVVVSGWLSDVRGFNDFLQDCLVQVCGERMMGLNTSIKKNPCCTMGLVAFITSSSL